MKNALGVLLLLFFSGLASLCFAAEDNHLAANFWGLSHHQSDRKGYNEQNWGLGLRAYHKNWFVAVDQMRNSARGQTRAIGIGYEYPLIEIKGAKFSIAAEAAHLDYEFPGRGTARGILLLPFVSVRVNEWSGNVGLIPPNGKREAIVLFFVTWHFKGF